MYITGGLGAAAGTEGFGSAYELPNAEAYNETCAAVANMLWNYRLFLLTGHGKYLDVFERTLYNGFLSGVSLEGNTFFYPNPLAADGISKFNQGLATRSPWFNTSCCPTNIARFLPSLPGYVYAVRDDQVFINLFVAGTGTMKTGNQNVQITQQTNYPWEGKMTFTLQPEKPTSFALHLRLPGWARNEPTPGTLYAYADDVRQDVRQDATPAITLKVNGKEARYTLQDGFAVLQRTWQPGDQVELNLSMPVRQVTAHEKVAADRRKVALERGPLVYCVEGKDNGGSLKGIVLAKNTAFQTTFQPDLLQGIVTIRGRGGQAFTAIPYYAWSNRGADAMAVWLPEGR